MNRRRTRVLVLDQAIGLWGAQRCLLGLAPLLADRGVDLVLGCPSDLALRHAWTAAGLEHIEVPLPTLRSVRADGQHGRVSLRAVTREARAEVDIVRDIVTAARRADVDLLHANGHGVHLDAALAGRMAGLPVLLYLHEEMPQRVGALVRAVSVALAQHSAAVSSAVAGQVPRSVRGRVSVLRNGVDTTHFAPGQPDPRVRAALGAAPGDVLVAALTRLDPEKRIEDVVSALALFRDRPGWHLAVVGETSSYPAYAASVARLARERLGDGVTLTGRRDDVAAVLRATDLVVHAGVIEGMPLGLMEAQACAVPVVAYRVAGVPEVIEHGVTGVLAPALDVAALSAGVDQLLADPRARLTMGRAGRRRIEAHFTLPGQATTYSARVAALVGRHAAAAVHV